MDRLSSLMAALDAGKLPSHKQVDAWTSWLSNSGLLQVEPSPDTVGSELSAQGKILIGDLREILESYRTLSAQVNDDDTLQDALYHLSSADLKNTNIETGAMDVDSDEATQDINNLRAALRTLLSHAWSHASSEGQGLLYDFASFTRLTLADGAEFLEQTAASTKQSLREVDAGVQEGERNPVTGTKRPAEGEPEDADARVKFEKTMDQVKVAGSKTIGAGQSIKAGAENVAERSQSRLQEALYKICDRAQGDQEYQRGINTLFNITEKWFDRALDNAADVNRESSLETFIVDPTPEQHVPKALRGIRSLVERLAGGKSLDDFFAAARTCAADIAHDPDTRGWFDEFFKYTRKCLSQPEYVRSDDADREYRRLRRRWQELLDVDSDVGRKWKNDIAECQTQMDALDRHLRNNQNLNRLRSAQAKLTKDLAEDLWVVEKGAQGVAYGASSVLSQGAWIWQDIFGAYIPRALALLRDIPIPRTEYSDNDIEFILEDLDISTLSFLPGHVYIRNITDVDISAPANGQVTTAMGAFTHIHATGVQLALKEISFYYLDKTATIGPSEFTGIMEVTLPPQGLEVDIRVRLLPNTAAGLKERERRGGFHRVESVKVEVHDDTQVDIRESNHAVVVSVMKPLMMSRFRSTLAAALAEQIRASLSFLDGLAWDVSCRAEVFRDTGLPQGASFTAALWSEIGHLSRGEGGLMAGWRATGTGIVREDVDGDGIRIAMGAEPQILSPDKHGPKATFAEPLKDKALKAADQANIDVEGGAKEAAGKAQELTSAAASAVQQGMQQIRGFKEEVEAKAEKEKESDGWRSDAFDL